LKIDPDYNEQRIGIVAFRLVGFENSSEVDSKLSVKIMIKGTPAVEVFSGELDLKLAMLDGIKVHFFMLENGEYRLEAGTSSGWSGADFSVSELSMRARSIGAQMRAFGSPLVFGGSCDSGYYPYDESVAVPWFDRPDAHQYIVELEKSGKVNPNLAAELRRFVDDGYLTIEECFPNEFVNAVNQDIDKAIASNYNSYVYGSSERIEHLHFHYENMRRLWLNTEARDIVEILFQGLARPSQTLTFVFGSQQDAHQDTIHLTPFPAGYMCGAWVALQDIKPDSGELVVYKGSHREPRLRMKEFDCAKVKSDWTEFGGKVTPKWVEMSAKYEATVYRPKKGTLLIWHENLLHSGSKRIDQGIERRSVVIHYFSDDSVAYYDSTGMAGMAASKELLSA
jgi:hypothetical protein